MNKDDFIAALKNAAKKGTLMTPKHDPSNLTTTFSCYRSILSTSLASNLNVFIDSGQYTVNEYENLRYPRSPIYMEIIPASGSDFSIPASGVLANSPMASTALDRLVAASGTIQGWHLFGENSQVIQIKVKNGDLNKREPLN